MKLLEHKLTLRDRFAMTALNGYLANRHYGYREPQELARLAWVQADAMLAAREAPNDAD